MIVRLRGDNFKYGGGPYNNNEKKKLPRNGKTSQTKNEGIQRNGLACAAVCNGTLHRFDVKIPKFMHGTWLRLFQSKFSFRFACLSRGMNTNA